jgi:RimJ/RimL family protein N-acetyltransferase
MNLENKTFITHLENEVVFLRQTVEEDFDELYNQGGIKEIWEQHSNIDRYKKNKFWEYFNGGLNNDLGCFTLISKKENRIVGWSRFYNYNKNELSIRIGYTFIGKGYWGTNINYNTKKVMLDYVFTFLEVIYFDVYEKNIRSQKSILKLGCFLSKINGTTHEYILTKTNWLDE